MIVQINKICPYFFLKNYGAIFQTKCLEKHSLHYFDIKGAVLRYYCAVVEIMRAGVGLPTFKF